MYQIFNRETTTLGSLFKHQFTGIQVVNYYSVPIAITITGNIWGAYYCYWKCMVGLFLLLLLLLETLRKPVTITSLTITITFPITITFIITVEEKKYYITNTYIL